MNSGSRSLSFKSRPEARYWWFKDRNYVPAVFALLTDEEWAILDEWYGETDARGSAGEANVPALSFLLGMVDGNGIPNVVQLGHYEGFSTLLLGFMMRRMGQKQSIFSVDISPECSDITRFWVDKAGLADYVAIHVASSDGADLPDEARRYFGGEIASVFVDSSHEYAHTRRELDLWFPELTPGGFIFLHDASAGACQFDPSRQGGVVRAIAEWSGRPDATLWVLNIDARPGQGPDELVYQDGCGLGVIQRRAASDGDNAFAGPEALRGALAATAGELVNVRAELSTAYGERETERREREAAQRERDTALAELSTALAELATALDELATARDELGTAQADLSVTRSELSGAQDDLSAAHRDLAAATVQIAAIRAERDGAIAQLLRVRAALATAEAAAAALQQQQAVDQQEHARQRAEWEARLGFAVHAREQAEAAVADVERRLAEGHQELAAIVSSTLWRSTYPMRVVGARMPRPLRRALRGGARVAWWTVTLGTLHRRGRATAALPSAAGVLPAPAAASAAGRPSRLRLTLSVRRRLAERRDRAALQASELFDPEYYLGVNQDVAASGIDPYLHYLRYGAGEGRDPSPSFRTGYYLDRYPDAARSGLNPLLHYLRIGDAEGRQTNPLEVLAPPPPAATTLPAEQSAAPPSQPRHHPQIVFVSGLPGSPSEGYRVFNPLGILQTAYQTEVMTVGEIGYHAELLKHAGIIVLFRVAWSEQLAEIIEAARANGGIVVYDIDDYVFEPAIANPDIIDGMRFLSDAELATYHEGIEGYRRALLETDCCIVSTEFLAERVRELGRPAYVLPNSVSVLTLWHYDEALQQRRERTSDGRLRIGYAAGTLTHQRDFAVVHNVLVELLRQRDDVLLTIVGRLDLSEYPDLQAVSERIELRSPVPHEELPRELARFDINLAPLELGNPFCEAKSELKFFNAALVEVPTVATATSPYRAAIRHGESGFLAADEAQWRDALTRLLDDRRLRIRVGKLARSEALRQFGPGAMRGAVGRLYGELWQLRRPVTPPRGAGYDHFLYAINFLPAPLRPQQQRAAGRDGGLDLHWIVPAFSVGWGGMTNIFRIVQHLEKFGHRNTLWVHNPPAKLPDGLTVSEYYRGMIADHFPPVAAEVHPLPRDLGRIAGDAVIATDHSSAYPARAVPNVQGRFYFLQDNEPAFSPAGYAALFAEATYRFGFDALSNGAWLHALAQRYGMWSVKWEQAADPEHYFATGSEERLPGHIAFYARQETPRRAVELGFLAFELLARDGVDFHVHLFGGVRSAGTLPYEHTHHGILSAAELGELYRRASVGVVFSATNYSIIPREMMACGLPVLELNSESSRASFPGGVADLAAPTPEGVAAHLKALLQDATHRDDVARRARDFLGQFSWEKSARAIEDALLFRLGRRAAGDADRLFFDYAAGE